MIPDAMMRKYFERTVGKLYKILPLKECEEETLKEYLDTLLTELVGVELLDNLSSQPYYMSIIGIVSYLSDNISDCSVKKVKKNVFRAIDLCKKLEASYKGGGIIE